MHACVCEILQEIQSYANSDLFLSTGGWDLLDTEEFLRVKATKKHTRDFFNLKQQQCLEKKALEVARTSLKTATSSVQGAQKKKKQQKKKQRIKKQKNRRSIASSSEDEEQEEIDGESENDKDFETAPQADN